MSVIGSVILAAGASRRLGEDKQFLRHRGESLIHRSARVANEAGLIPCVVVTGQAHDRIVKQLDDLDVLIARHQEWERGIGSSLRLGVQRALDIEPHLEALVIMVCDQPFAGPDILRSLVDAYLRVQARISACAYGGTIGVPALFTRALFDQLLNLRDDAGAKSLLMKERAHVVAIDFPLGTIDIDTPEDRDTKLQPDSDKIASLRDLPLH